MPRDRDKWIEEPAWSWTAYLITGKEIRLTSVDLLGEVVEMSSPERRERSEHRVHGYLISSWILQALAAEYLLKSLSIRDAGRFSKTHDLLQLFKALDLDTQAEIARQGAQEGIDIPELLKKHRSAVVEWRYPFEEMSAIPEPQELDDVLAVLVGVCEPGSPQARRMMEHLTQPS
ncbi:MAG: HEPN domain-containing protein [Acidobacteriia bacterium]|nr:HEPN domain-containing protein [Terriglobia bacterium]